MPISDTSSFGTWSLFENVSDSLQKIVIASYICEIKSTKCYYIINYCMFLNGS